MVSVGHVQIENINLYFPFGFNDIHSSASLQFDVFTQTLSMVILVSTQRLTWVSQSRTINWCLFPCSLTYYWRIFLYFAEGSHSVYLLKFSPFFGSYLILRRKQLSLLKERSFFVFIPHSLCIFITPFWGGFSSVWDSFLPAFNLYLKQKCQEYFEFKALLNLKDGFGPLIGSSFKRLSCLENVTRCTYKIRDESSLYKFRFLMYILNVPHHAILNQSSMLASRTGIDDSQLLSPALVCTPATFTEMSWLGAVLGAFERSLLPLKWGMKNISNLSRFSHFGPDLAITGAVILAWVFSQCWAQLGVVTCIEQALWYWGVLVATKPLILHMLLSFWQLIQFLFCEEGHRPLLPLFLKETAISRESALGCKYESAGFEGEPGIPPTATQFHPLADLALSDGTRRGSKV